MMNPQEIRLRVEITAYIDHSQPGWVQCRLVDAHGRTWTFHEKVPVVGVGDLDATTAYPQTGEIACEVIRRSGGVATVNTARPWGVESVEGETRFDVPESMLVTDAD